MKRGESLMTTRTRIRYAVAAVGTTVSTLANQAAQVPDFHSGAVHPVASRAQAFNVPESAVLLLFGIGLSTIGFAARRRARKRTEEKRVASDARESV
jgi:hypothetical protein